MNAKTPIFGITGWKNSGKTRMVAALVSEFSARGLTVSTVKHAHHSFDIDHEGTDSWQHRKAGAREVALVSRNRWALMHELENEDEPPLAVILTKLAPCDLVLIEGFKREGHPKIEMIRKEASRDAPLWPDDPSIVVIGSTDRPEGCDLAVIDPESIAEIADFITEFLKLNKQNAAE
jgi:molybdopterin-guanine dinucleotide biosynthesis protein B